MNVVPFLCPMALNLHQKRPSPVTSGRLFHRAIRREIVAPSFVLMAMVQGNYPRHPSFRHTIQREIAVPSFVLMAMVQQSYPCHPPFHRAIRREIAPPSFVLMAMVQGNYPLGGYTFDRAGLMSAAKSTLSDDVCHSMLPPWGLYFF